jgi:hypothetical protein
MSLSRRCPLKISPPNQQLLPQKWEKQDFDEDVHRLYLTVKSRVGKLTCKHLSQKEELDII